MGGPQTTLSMSSATAVRPLLPSLGHQPQWPCVHDSFPARVFCMGSSLLTAVSRLPSSLRDVPFLGRPSPGGLLLTILGISIPVACQAKVAWARVGAGLFRATASLAVVTPLPSWFQLPRRPPVPAPPITCSLLPAPGTRWVAGGRTHLGFLCCLLRPHHLCGTSLRHLVPHPTS